MSPRRWGSSKSSSSQWTGGKLSTQPALRPLAPNPMCFASTSATIRLGLLDLRCCTAESPANPPPTTATSANCAPDNDGDVAICESNQYEVLNGKSFIRFFRLARWGLVGEEVEWGSGLDRGRVPQGGVLRHPSMHSGRALRMTFLFATVRLSTHPCREVPPCGRGASNVSYASSSIIKIL